MLLIRIEKFTLWLFWGFWAPYSSSQGKAGFPYLSFYCLSFLYCICLMLFMENKYHWRQTDILKCMLGYTIRSCYFNHYNKCELFGDNLHQLELFSLEVVKAPEAPTENERAGYTLGVPIPFSVDTLTLERNRIMLAFRWSLKKTLTLILYALLLFCEPFYPFQKMREKNLVGWLTWDYFSLSVRWGNVVTSGMDFSRACRN